MGGCSFSATNKVVEVVEVTSPERVARNLTWTVGLFLPRAMAPKLPKSPFSSNDRRKSTLPVNDDYLAQNQTFSHNQKYMTPKKITNVSKRFVHHMPKLGPWRFRYVKIDQHLLLEPSIDKQRELSCAPNIYFFTCFYIGWINTVDSFSIFKLIFIFDLVYYTIYL